MFTALLPVSLLLFLLSLCSAGGFGVVPCPLGFFFFFLGRTSSPRVTSRTMRLPSLKVKKRSPCPQSRSSQRPPPSLAAPPRHRQCQGPLHENMRWDVSPVLPKHQLFRGQGQKEGVSACLCIPMCILPCVWVCVCVCVLEWNDQGRAEAVKLIVYEVNSTRCPVLPRPPSSFL